MAVRDEWDLSRFVNGFKILILLQTIFAGIDIVGKYGFGTDLLEFLRTANYSLLSTDVVSGVWRINGIEAEASYLATVMAGELAFCFALWRSGLDNRFAPVMFVLLAVILVISTSSSAYVFLALGGGWCLSLFLYQMASGRIGKPILLVVLLSTILVITVALWVLLFQPQAILIRANQFLDHLLFNKMSTESGIERSSWNEAAWENLLDTFGFGVGLGSSRTSSWALALLGQTGVPGVLLYGTFVLLLIVPATRRGQSLSSHAATWRHCFQAYVLATLAVASVSWNLVYLGVTFGIVTGLIARLSYGYGASIRTSGLQPYMRVAP